MLSTHRHHRNAGFSLLEILIALVVLSLGLLGLAGLQATGLRNNNSSYYRTLATQQAYDLADRMRANSGGVIAGAYKFTAIPASTKKNCRSTYIDSTATAVSCTPTDMAEDDMYEWLRTLALTLPSGQGIVCIDSSPDGGTPAAPGCDGNGSTYVIKVWWDDSHGANSLQEFVTVFRP